MMMERKSPLVNSILRRTTCSRQDSEMASMILNIDPNRKRRMGSLKKKPTLRATTTLLFLLFHLAASKVSYTSPSPTVSRAPSNSSSTQLPTASNQTIESSSGGPTLQPSNKTSNSTTPSPQPMQTPTLSPTDSPISTVDPTNPPSFFPTLSPVKTPTKKPSKSPTTAPTKSPVTSAKPTTPPNSLPTPAPISSVSSQPTPNPTKTKTSAKPTPKPSLMLQTSPIIANVVMKFDDCKKLDNSSLKEWDEVTTKYVREAMSANLYFSGMQFSDLQVNISFKGQIDPFRLIRNSTSQNGDVRSLQSSELWPLDLIFDVLIMFRSPNLKHDWQNYFIDTLNTKKDLVDYLKALSSSGDEAFFAINNVTVEIDGRSITQIQEIPENVAKKPFGGAGLIVVCAAAAAVVALTAIMFIVLRKKGARDQTADDYIDQGEKVAPDDDGMYIEVQHANDDVSTLGDMFAGNWQSQQRFDDATVGESTIKADTVYQNYISGNVNNSKTKRSYFTQQSPSSNPYSSTVEDDVVISKDGVESTPPFQGSTPNRSNQESVSSDTMPEPNVNPTVQRDFETICYGEEAETRIEVNAPPGKLGVIIDAAKNRQLIVNSIKPSSPLADLVREGDALISVDGESTTGLTAHRCSSLISSKADNPRRVLVFLRSASA